ncbi:MAG: hypothetical protein JWL71_3380 [Acidobacteria bacterium]|nr:hypothetical protein [Acidobacteriota bacterium]
MKSTFRLVLPLTAWLAMIAPAAAQQTAAAQPPDDMSSAPKATVVDSPPAAASATEAGEDSVWKKGRPQTIQYMRALDQRGINTFETTKTPGVEYKGFKLDFGAAFATQLQNVSHGNTAAPNVVSGVDANQLMDIGLGFNTPTANLYINAQLAPGVRVAMTSYLSSRHHNETWVKDGYIQIDQSPIDFAPLKAIMEIVTLRVGDMEINYGDAHFRRSDNGHAAYNPFVGNYIMDAFTTQVGGEVYLKASNIIAMAALTAGELNSTVLSPERRSPVYIGKIGVDRQMTTDLRVRLTGSMYKTDKAMSDTLYNGDRAGSRFYFVLENTAATESAQKNSGLLDPGFSNKVTAMQMNPFVKFRGLELFGVVERSEGRAATETSTRVWNQYALDTVYRFADDKVFGGVRYNKAQGALVGIPNTVGAERWEVGGGWFVTPNVLAKAEYVNQTYNGYPVSSIKNGGKFNGIMLEGVVAF